GCRCCRRGGRCPSRPASQGPYHPAPGPFYVAAAGRTAPTKWAPREPPTERTPRSLRKPTRSRWTPPLMLGFTRTLCWAVYSRARLGLTREADSPDPARVPAAMLAEYGLKPGRALARSSGRLRAQPHAECTDNFRHGLETRISVWRERFVESRSGDAGIFRELHHAARSSDNTQGVNQHLPIHGCFEYRLEVVLDIGFGLQVIRRIVGRHLALSAFALGCHGHSFLAGFLTGRFNSFHIACAFLMSASWLPLSPPHSSR